MHRLRCMGMTIHYLPLEIDMSIYEIHCAIKNWFSANPTIFYAGIRADCAIALGLAPCNARFHAAWDGMEFESDGNGHLVAFAPC